jgi:flavin reductase (DIM6/NTAB) family NADH-FMN oxidoreductase RutF
MTEAAFFPKTTHWDALQNPKQFRQALGQFATGITIVTTRIPSTSEQPEQLEGVTINSFNSLSLEPPLVLWSLSKTARTLSLFSKADHYLIHVLSANQQALCEHFAYGAVPRFANMDYKLSPAGMPVLPDALLWLECRHHQQIDLGDHRLFIGEVTAFSRGPSTAPLVFHAGQFHHLP